MKPDPVAILSLLMVGVLVWFLVCMIVAEWREARRVRQERREQAFLRRYTPPAIVSMKGQQGVTLSQLEPASESKPPLLPPRAHGFRGADLRHHLSQLDDQAVGALLRDLLMRKGA